MKKRARTSKKPTKTKMAPKSAAKPIAKTAAKTYTPTPIQGIGWAPFRYPAS